MNDVFTNDSLKGVAEELERDAEVLYQNAYLKRAIAMAMRYHAEQDATIRAIWQQQFWMYHGWLGTRLDRLTAKLANFQLALPEPMPEKEEV